MSADAMDLLDAGAVLPAGTVVAKDDTVDTLTARRYAHPVLAERTVVRLVSGTLGEAEDLSMEFLGFARPERVAQVGVVRQQALGFPAWALVHDPANGHHALALVKEIERLARTARSRVGPAKDGFNALGERLARSVPHFLPTFYEEAGRAFLAADSVTYAASMFGRAREAERAYALTIDEERQHAVFLEFALAGALTAKALSNHARDLATRCEPSAAYDRFLRLCVERTLGGLPPYAAMHTDLRRLARKAGVDPVATDERVLRELLDAPAISRAPEAFWVAYRAPLARLAAADPALRGRLLGLVPEHCGDDVWLGVLEDAGATAALTEPAGSVPAGADSPDGPAGWLRRFDEHRERRSWRTRNRHPGLLALVERMAGRLKSDGAPVALCRKHDGVDLDLLDTCLALGVPVADPARAARYWVEQWLSDETDGRRDLVATAADPRFLPALREGVESQLQPGWRDENTDPTARVGKVIAVPGLRTALQSWLDTVADAVARQGLPTLDSQLDRVGTVACPAGFAVNPEAVRRVVDHDLGPVLGRTLRAGLLDEYGWPALESAAERLGLTGEQDKDLQVIGQWPYLLLRRGDLVLVVGRDGVEYEHLMRIPADERRYMWRLVLRYVDGQLLVCWDRGPDRAGYWSGAPEDVFTVADDAFAMNAALSLPLPGGGRTFGRRPLRVGDRGERTAGRIISDGSTYWVRSGDQAPRWREYDPATGEPGRFSVPAFFEDGAVDGQPLDADLSWLRPTESSESPLGRADGLAGWRARRRPDGGWAGEAVDGRSFALPAGTDLDGKLAGAVRFPGATATYGLLSGGRGRNGELLLCADDGFLLGRYALDGEASTSVTGTRLLPPVAFWHFLRPRDEAGSAALRAVTDEQAGALLAEAAGLDTAQVRALVGRYLPQLTAPALVAGVAGIVEQAAGQAARLRTLAGVLAGRGSLTELAGSAGDQGSAGTEDAASDKLLAAGLSGLIRYCYCRGNSARRLIARAGAALTGAVPVPVDGVELDGDVDWFYALELLPAAMYRAAAPLTTPDVRDALLTLLETCARSGLVAPGSRVRRATLVADGTGQLSQDKGQVFEADGRRLLVLDVDTDDREVDVLEWAPTGRFGAVPGFRITRERILLGGAVTPERIGEFVRLVRENGPVAWRADRARALSEEAGMGHAEAVLLLAGLPEAAWERAEAEPARTTLGLPDPVAASVAARYWGSGRRRGGGGRVAELLGLLLPEDPAALWADGPRCHLIVEEWTRLRGRRRPVPDELIVAAHRANVASPLAASEVIHGVANPTTCRWLAGSVPRIDDDDVLTALTKTLPWLAYHLPATDPIRSALPVAARLVRQRLADPDFAVPVGHLDGKKIPALAAALGVPAVANPAGTEIGPVLIPPADVWHRVLLRPAGLRGVDDPVLVVLQARLDQVDESVFAALRALIGDQVTEVVSYAVPDAAEGFAQDPTRSAPDLVAAVGARLGLGADASALYLQLLALPDPTDRNVARWTGWKPARLKAARTELAATAHVVAAKRPRAGRSLFLPGGWLALKAPLLPLERWKLPLLIGDEGGVSALGIITPVAPAPRLFELAWARLLAGDAPRFDDLVTERR
ncbi:hypothetical protein OOK41_20410 [Micromonospora sp. NBC_01655]|uniref:hypothetical protein n=1 Tax=Micromonospora sp. NBC_01655 TaxID=2975983 RepID=UPI002250F2D2|nr:hypothetical protein [Micromonospora sp. NBC_01655]MCX4472641.1 hypothetical protein [Micromonospora sp. NBC_01655]